MRTPRAAEIARILRHDLGYHNGIRYARGIARTARMNGSPMAAEYTDAAEILEQQQSERETGE